MVARRALTLYRWHHAIAEIVIGADLCCEASGPTTDRAKAKKFLSKRLAEIATGTFNGLEVERVTITELADGFLRDYKVNGRRSLAADLNWKEIGGPL